MNGKFLALIQKRFYSLCLLVPVVFFVSTANAQTIVQLKVKSQGGDAAAQLALGNAYFTGKGIAKNDDLAFKWYLAAAEQGNVEAQTKVGNMYRSGTGVPQDKELAVGWYAKAAARGDATARYNLATAYYNGEGTGVDDRLSYIWFVLAAEAGDKQAEEAVARTESEHDEVWLADALFKLAEMLERGDGLQVDAANAASKYAKVIQHGAKYPEVRSQAHVRLAIMLLEGRGVQRDVSTAQTNCEAAASVGYSGGYACLGYIHLNATAPPNPVEGAKAYKKAAELGHPYAAFRMGQLYEAGEGVKQDKMLAYAYYTIAAGRRHEGATKEKERLEQALTSEEIKKARKKLNEPIRSWK